MDSPVWALVLILAAAVAHVRLPTVAPLPLVVLAAPPALHLRRPFLRRRCLLAAHQLSGQHWLEEPDTIKVIQESGEVLCTRQGFNMFR